MRKVLGEDSHASGETSGLVVGFPSRDAANPKKELKEGIAGSRGWP